MADTPAEELRSTGRAQRKESPRSSLAELTRSNRTALEILQAQNASRLRDLVPLRFARMLADPFSFYRGAAAVMAADLATSPTSGIEALSCGDAHITNFGLYASPARDLVFDVNDFDEAGFAPWEWDVKRLVTSAVVGGRQAGHSAARVEKTARSGVSAYLRGLHNLLSSDALTRFYRQNHPGDIARTLPHKDARVLEKAIHSATKRTSARVFRKITETGPDGELRLRENPPLLERLADEPRAQVSRWVESYLRSASPDIALLLSQFRLVDVARRVVGVGSVGTRCFLAVLLGPADEPLVLQVKQAQPSVLVQWGERSLPPVLTEVVTSNGEGARVVAVQKILQATTDPFVGSMQADGFDLYVRQFHDMKGSLDLSAMSAKTFEHYVEACASQLARAHAQSRRAFEIAGYAGGGGQIIDGITTFALAYADATAHDFQEVTAAAARGEIDVASDALQ